MSDITAPRTDDGREPAEFEAEMSDDELIEWADASLSRARRRALERVEAQEPSSSDLTIVP